MNEMMKIVQNREKKDIMNRVYQRRYQLEMKKMKRLCLRLKGKIRIGRKDLIWAEEITYKGKL